jgi:hypothetical protein
MDKPISKPCSCNTKRRKNRVRADNYVNSTRSGFASSFQLVLRRVQILVSGGEAAQGAHGFGAYAARRRGGRYVGGLHRLMLRIGERQRRTSWPDITRNGWERQYSKMSRCFTYANVANREGS